MSPEKYRSVVEYVSANPGVSYSVVGKRFGVSRHAVRRAINSGGMMTEGGVANRKADIETVVSDNSMMITTRSCNIKTLEDALAHAKVDLDIWDVDRFVVNSWETTMKHSPETTGYSNPEDHDWTSTTNHKIDSYTNFQVKVWLKRRIAKPVVRVLDGIIAKMESHSPVYPEIIRPGKRTENFMLEMSLFDHHMGLRSWGEETGENYDLEISESIYRQAVLDMLEYTRPFPVEQILFPIGQDFLHVNDSNNVTPKGKNILDVDSRFAKIIDVGYNTLVAALDACLSVAPVKVVWIPGNHDPETSLVVSLILKAHYRKCKDIEFDVRPKRRKSVVYGPTLLCFAHGQDESRRDLPMVVASEERVDFGKCKHFEIHLGHLHKTRETRLVTADTLDGGVVVRVLPSLSAADSWHYAHGWSVRPRAAEAYLWSDQRGYSGHFSVNAVRPE